MSHSFAAVYYHCVFSTKRRAPEIQDPNRLWSYLHGIARNHNIVIRAVGGTRDHVHLLLSLPLDMPIGKAVQALKANSSRLLADQKNWSGWQEGYSVFSVSPTAINAVRGYIDDQELHHAKRDFKKELELMLRQAGFNPADCPNK